jgi:uncharacterized protein (TIGR00290 family)
MDVVVSWSGGKDCALALKRVLDDSRYRVVALLTTINHEQDRVMMHGVGRKLIEAQAQSCGLPLHLVNLPNLPGNEVYEGAMNAALRGFVEQGASGVVCGVVFGDIFLEDVRAFREKSLVSAGLQGIFPLWKHDTRELAQEFVSGGYSGITSCVDSAALPPAWCGRVLDADFFRTLPPNVDACGENGEFHSFVTQAPFFATPVNVAVGERDEKERFVYCDLVQTI